MERKDEILEEIQSIITSGMKPDANLIARRYGVTRQTVGAYITNTIRRLKSTQAKITARESKPVISTIEPETISEQAIDKDDSEFKELEDLVADLMEEVYGPMFNLLAASRLHGEWKKKKCFYLIGEFCKFWRWDDKPNMPGCKPAIEVDTGKWLIAPTAEFCANCPCYEAKE